MDARNGTETMKRLTQEYHHSTPDLAHVRKQYRCMWCTSFISSTPLGTPLGCPVQEVARLKPNRRYFGGDTVTKIPSFPLPSSVVTYGIFCSWSCVKAFIHEHSTDPRFRHSLTLLSDVTGGRAITAAPHYTLLKAFGGILSEKQFQETLDREQNFVVKNIISMCPMSVLFQDVGGGPPSAPTSSSSVSSCWRT